MAKKSILYIITKSVWGGAAKYVYDLASRLPKDEFVVSAAAGGQEKFAQEIKKANLPYFKIKNFQKTVNPLKDAFAFFEILRLLFRLKPGIIHVNSSKAGGVAGLACFIYKLFYRLKYQNLFPERSERSEQSRRVPEQSRRDKFWLKFVSPSTSSGTNKLSGPKTIFTAHGWAFTEDRPQWQIFLIKFFSKITALFYDKIICVSGFDREMAIKNKIAPAHKLIAIHNGIDIKTINFLPKEQAQKKLLGRTSPLVIGTIAEWTKNKGLFYLLEAVTKIENPSTRFARSGNNHLTNSNLYPEPVEGPNLYPEPVEGYKFNIILIGSGENPDKEKMYNFVKKHNLENVHLIEWIDKAAFYLKAFDIFVLPSVKEGFPYTILEAMAAELPIITTAVGGIPEAIENNVNGILVQPKNSQPLAEKILYLLNNPEKARGMAQKARKRAGEEFSLEKMVEKTKNLYY